MPSTGAYGVSDASGMPPSARTRTPSARSVNSSTRRVLGGLLGRLLRHGHLERSEIWASRGGIRPHVVFHRDRGGDHPGAVAGIVWQDRGLSFGAAFRKLR